MDQPTDQGKKHPLGGESGTPVTGLQRGAVSLVDSVPEWNTEFRSLTGDLRRALGSAAAEVEHIGSTAVAGLVAKPIIDIGVLLSDSAEIAEVTLALENAGFVNRGDHGDEGGILFVRGQQERRTAHIHLLRWGDPQWEGWLRFRDQLRTNSALRNRYAQLKRRLAGEYPDDRDAYTSGKEAFIKDVLGE